jgi:hypothetical protein
VAVNRHSRFVAEPFQKLPRFAQRRSILGEERRREMPCYLLHMIEAPDPEAYDDPDLKDLVGQWPKLFCAHCNPPRPLPPASSMRCLDRDAPCWKPANRICE